MSICDELKLNFIVESAQLGAVEIEIARQSELSLRQLAGTFINTESDPAACWNSANIPSLMGRSKQDLST